MRGRGFPLRIVFAGTPEVAVPTLRALVESGHHVVGVITREPKRRGRSKALVSSEVGQFAAKAGLNVLETSRPGDPEETEWIQNLDADLGVVVAYGALLPQRVLDLPGEGWVNLHFSKLPDLRGAAPVQRAVIRGDEEIGCSVFQLEKGMDTGPIFSQKMYPQGVEKTAGQVLADLSVLGAEQVLEVVDEIASGEAQAVPQDEGAGGANVTFAPKLTRADGFVDFRAPARATVDLVRGVTPDPGAWTTLPDGRTMKLRAIQALPDAEPHTARSNAAGSVTLVDRTVRVACQGGDVILTEVAPAGKNWMKAADWWRGARLEEGATLGQPTEGN